MAIAETEPKKNEIGITSTRPTDSVKSIFCVSSSIADKAYLTDLSSSGRVIKSYQLYRNIKDFHFFMPSGWTDEDLGIFVQACKENFDDLKHSDESIKWKKIANFGAQRSRNLTLFSINSCMEVAQCLKNYVGRKENTLGDNDTFKKLNEDVSDLLPYFPEPKVLMGKSVSTEKSKITLEEYFRGGTVENTIFSLVNSNIGELKRESETNIFSKISDALQFLTGIKIEAYNFLVVRKESIIFDLLQIDDIYVREKAFFKITEGFIDIFDMIEPKQVLKNDFIINKETGLPFRKISELAKDKKRRLPHLELMFGTTGNKHENAICSSSSSGLQLGTKSSNEKSVEIPKEINERNKNVKGENDDVESSSGEPTSTTYLDEGPSHIGIDSGGSSPSTNYFTRKEKLCPTKRSIDIEEKSDENEPNEEQLKVPRLRRAQRGPRPRERPIPARVLPFREAKRKINASSMKDDALHNKQSVNPDSPDTTNNVFRGFEDGEGPLDESRSNMRMLRRNVTLKRTITMNQNAANPDTTTVDDDSDSGFSNSREGSYEKRLPRRSKDLKDKSLPKCSSGFLPDSTMQPIVIIERLQKTQFNQENHGMHRYEGCSSSLPAPSAKQNTPVESAVLGKDVIKTVYNPLADSAKIIVAPTSPQELRKTVKKHVSRKKPSSDNLDGSGQMDEQEICYTSNKDFRPHSKIENSVSTASCFVSGMNIGDQIMPEQREFGTSLTSSLLQPSTSSVLPSTESSLAIIRNSPEVSSLNPNHILEVYHRKPTWYDSFFEEMRKQQAWKVLQFKKMQQEILTMENKKIHLIEKLIDTNLK